MNREGLFAEALEAARSAYAPYSNFRVGAVLVCSDGTRFRGVNVENRSFGLTVCAERSAVSAALSVGRRDFAEIVVATPDADYPVSPCGACRQVLSEFLPPEAPVMFGATYEGRVETTVGALYPHDALHELKHRSS